MTYKKAYAILLCTMSDTIDELYKVDPTLQEITNAIAMLKQGLEIVEEMYASSGD